MIKKVMEERRMLKINGLKGIPHKINGMEVRLKWLVEC
jgi:hypothetical protein